MKGAKDHEIHRVSGFEVETGYVLRVCFEDGSVQRIDLEPVLEGEIYGPLRDLDLFRSVRVDPEAHTLVWPNGADFDPATLHDWPRHAAAFAERGRVWRTRTSRSG
jgi:hypothetical protein